MFYELREYYIKKGMREKWVALMDDMVIPFQKEKGMVIVGSFVSLDEADCYIWIRRFETRDEQKRLYDRVYGSDYWRETVRKAMGDMLVKERTRVTLMAPTPGSELG